MEPIPSLFSSSPDENREQSIPPGATLPLDVRTSDAQWAYAVRFTRRDAVPEPLTALLIQVSLRVISGSVGVGCLNCSETAFVDETFVTHTNAPTTVDVLVARPADAGALIIRNASADGASDVSVLGVECFAVAVEDDDTARTPGLSDPRPCAGWSRYYGTLGETIAEKSRIQTYRSLDAALVLRWSDGMAIRILPGEQLSRALYVSGTYEPNTLCALRSLLQPGDTFIDVGANTGVISLVASRWVGPTGRIYSFEPSRREYDNLLANVMQNAARNVTPVRAAVTSASGSATLRVAPSSYAGLNTLGSAFPYAGVDIERLESVETITLDAFAERQRLDRVAVIKLDVEGSEGDVLQGSRRLLEDHRPAIIAEIMARSLVAKETTVESLERLLKDAGYRLFLVNDTTATLEPVATLDGIDEQNIIALPSERR
jgi:FkbM family methyltransferase